MGRRVLLVGGGHAHLQVVRAWPASPDVELVLVSDRRLSVYSGMLPGWLAGEYREEELSIDLAALCAQAGARFVACAAESVDVEEHRVVLADGTALDYDFASFDIGSTVAGLAPGPLSERAIPARPVAGFIARMEELRAKVAGADAGIAVVGGGAAGVELALALRKIRPDGAPVHLVESSDELLPGAARRAQQAARAACLSRGVRLHLGSPVAGASGSGAAPGLVLANGETVAADAWVWVTGAAAPAIFRRSGVDTDARGFVRVRETLAWVSSPDVFAAGDCAALDHAPETPRSGVYAVRAGPILLANLRARLSGAPLRAFRPQRHALMMLNLGDGEALAVKWGLAVRGRSVRRWKDRIDRRFVERYPQPRPSRDA